MSWDSFTAGVWRGETIYRVTFHKAVERHCHGVRGRALDVCAGPPGQFYRQGLEQRGVRLVRADRSEKHRPHVILDADWPLPFRSERFDAVLLFNAIYILAAPERTLAEVRRILKPGGCCYVASPFVFNESQDIHDYARYTREGLRRLFGQAGFAQVDIHAFGERGSSAIYLLQPFLPFRPMRCLAYLLGYAIDACVPRRIRERAGAPLGYFVVGQR